MPVATLRSSLVEMGFVCLFCDLVTVRETAPTVKTRVRIAIRIPAAYEKNSGNLVLLILVCFVITAAVQHHRDQSVTAILATSKSYTIASKRTCIGASIASTSRQPFF